MTLQTTKSRQQQQPRPAKHSKRKWKHLEAKNFYKLICIFKSMHKAKLKDSRWYQRNALNELAL